MEFILKNSVFIVILLKKFQNTLKKHTITTLQLLDN